jgi:subtilisin family serine protease
MNFAVSDSRNRNCPRGVVVNMSLGGPASSAVNSAAAAIVNANIFLAVAAGNGDSLGRPVNINTVSPASEPSACTVGATDSSDRVASFSNFGNLLDVYAPGVNIASTYPGGRTNVALSGTSMASPHVAGLAAYYLGLGAATPSGMCDYLKSTAQRNAISGVPSGTANVFVKNGIA